MGSFKQFVEKTMGSAGVDMAPTQTATDADDIAQNWMSKPVNADNIAQMSKAQSSPSVLHGLVSKNATDAVRQFRLPPAVQKASQLDVARRMQSDLFPNFRSKLFMKTK